MSKQTKTVPVPQMSAERVEELAKLQAQFTTIHTIVGTDENGKELVMFLKKLSYTLRASVFMMLSQDISKSIQAGEMILLDCYIGGDNLYDSEDTRLEAALQAVDLFEFNQTFTLLKKK